MKRVLIAEHDSVHRDLIRDWLDEAGVRAVYADSPAEVAADICAIIVDVSCHQQARTALDSWRRAYPRATLVLVSGRFVAEDMSNHALAARLGVASVLAKPFTRADLWAALNLSPGGA
jgi:CheY-like chemotaxis protein